MYRDHYTANMIVAVPMQHCNYYVSCVIVQINTIHCSFYEPVILVGFLLFFSGQALKLQYKRHVRMEILDLEMVLTLLKAEWRCASTVPGEQSVTTASAHLMLMSHADSWAIDSMGLSYYQYLNLHKAVVLYSSMN